MKKMNGSEVLKITSKLKRITVSMLLFLFMTGIISTAIASSTTLATEIVIQLSDEENDFIYRTQNGNPLKVGIIPHTFPLSDCPPDAPDFVGINVDMLSAISQISGLKFEYQRIPIEKQSPYEMLQDGQVSLVAGTIKLNDFLTDSNLILSDRLSDGSAICIAKKGTNTINPTTNKVAVMNGYQAGAEFAEKQFPTYKISLYPNNQAVMHAVRVGDADLALISRYVGIYELQNPMNENLIELTMYQMEKDSCVMGINTEENKIAVSIINKALSAIGEDGYNYVQMNFSISNPYKLNAIEFIYKFRYIIIVLIAAFIGLSLLTTRLLYTQREHKRLSLDPLTGAYSEAGFELAAAKIISKTTKPLFITDFDIYRFSSYNELNGKSEGNELLKNIVKIVKSFFCEQDVICRSYADNFKVLNSKENIQSLIEEIQVAIDRFNEAAHSAIVLNFGVYPITDTTVPISKMLDFAAMAKKHVKNNSDTFIGVFDETLLERYVSQAKMTSAFSSALAKKEFVPYYQPKYDAITKTVVGAEALVRWIESDGVLIPPTKFIELFEKSGQIQQLDFYMLEEVCIFLKSLKANEIPEVPIAVNFSRVHLYSDEFIQQVNAIVERHNIPKNLIEIECTETTMLNNIELTREILGDLQTEGFSIAMDDFGSAYSSLNTLCSIPLDVIKLDSGFLMATLGNEKAKSNIIISSIMTLAHDLYLKVVAEGVETEEQYLLLKNLGCDFIQGYYFSKPLSQKDFLNLLIENKKES